MTSAIYPPFTKMAFSEEDYYRKWCAKQRSVMLKIFVSESCKLGTILTGQRTIDSAVHEWCKRLRACVEAKGVQFCTIFTLPDI